MQSLQSRSFCGISREITQRVHGQRKASPTCETDDKPSQREKSSVNLLPKFEATAYTDLAIQSVCV
jgi:hypothetical protein